MQYLSPEEEVHETSIRDCFDLIESEMIEMETYAEASAVYDAESAALMCEMLETTRNPMTLRINNGVKSVFLHMHYEQLIAESDSRTLAARRARRREMGGANNTRRRAYCFEDRLSRERPMTADLYNRELAHSRFLVAKMEADKDFEPLVFAFDHPLFELESAPYNEAFEIRNCLLLHSDNQEPNHKP